jgi:glycosyltransferase involved in cell wall biosynthesis
MRLLAITHSLGRSGAPIMLYRLLSHLRRSHKVTVLCTGGAGPLGDAFETIGIPVVPQAAVGDFDLILFNGLMTTSRFQAIGGRIPTAVWVHEPRFGLELFAGKMADAGAVAAADTVIFPTHWQAEHVYGPYLGQDNWTVVPAGVPDIPGPTESPLPARRGDELRLFLPATIEPRKGQDLLAAALQLLGDVPLPLFLAGKENAAEAFLAPLKADPRITLLGDIPAFSVWAAMKDVDAVVLPTRDDLVPLTLIEALFAGACVVSSDYGPIPRTLRHGRNGLLFPVGDARMLAATLRMIAADPELRARIAAEGRRHAVRHHDFLAHAAAMERALLQAAGRP